MKKSELVKLIRESLKQELAKKGRLTEGVGEQILSKEAPARFTSGKYGTWYTIGNIYDAISSISTEAAAAMAKIINDESVDYNAAIDAFEDANNIFARDNINLVITGVMRSLEVDTDLEHGDTFIRLRTT